MDAVEFSLFEIAGAAERNGAGVPQDLPLSLRGLYRYSGTGAGSGFAGNKTTVPEIKWQCHEMNNFSHE
jgi:hypothetical protein